MSSYTSSLTPLRAAITVSGISSSVFFLGNVAASRFGVMPAIQSGAAPLTHAQKAKLWHYFYDHAKPVFFGSSLVSTLAFAVVAYLTREEARWCAVAGALTSGAMGPWTAIQMAPVNNQIIAVSEGDAAKEPYVDKLVEKWRQLHLVRLVLGGVSYVSALVLASSVAL